MIQFLPSLTCEMLKWDVRMLVSLHRLQTRYHRDGYLDPVTKDSFDKVEKLLLDLRRFFHFDEAMEKYGKVMSGYMNGESATDFRLSCIMIDTIKMAFPAGSPDFGDGASKWSAFTLQYSTLTGGSGVLDYHCPDKYDAFDQLLSCCLTVPENDPNRQWVVDGLYLGAVPLTDEFYDWALAMLPPYMAEARSTMEVRGA